MALTQSDKDEIARLIAIEVERLRAEMAACAPAAPPMPRPTALEVRRVGAELADVPRQRPTANDQCCNGCD